MNRGNRTQPKGVKSIIADRHTLGDKLKNTEFDVVLDITAYSKEDISDLIFALPTVKDYIYLSSSAVYPETTPQPFSEKSPVGFNKYWQSYGVHKYEAEKCLQKYIPNAYILRPPYLYDPGENLYRELFCFDSALENQPFYVPKDGTMKLQFFHVKDLCRMIERILKLHPTENIFNVGNPHTVSVNEWVYMCYEVAHKKADLRYVTKTWNQRNYFCFYDYEYTLDITKQTKVLPNVIPLQEGLRETFDWYIANKNNAEIIHKPYRKFINSHINYRN